MNRTTALLLAVLLQAVAWCASPSVVLPDAVKSEAAVLAAAASVGQAIQLVGGASMRITAGLDPSVPADAYAWSSSGDTLRVRAATPLALAHGMERLAWEIRARAGFTIPDATEKPALPYRLAFVNLAVPDTLEGPDASPASVDAAMVSFRKELRRVLRFGMNYVVVMGLEDYVPWDDPLYGPRAARYRAYLKAAARAAHEHRLKILLYGDETLFLPSFLHQMNATLSVKDPRFWDALQQKHRLLLRAVPELDGIATRIGEMLPKYDFRAFDLVHSKETEPNPRLAARYRTYLLKMHAVVAGEFGKIFLHRNWVTSDWEQHSVPEVYREIFTDEIPTANLLVARKFTKQDAWYYGSAFNPTFGLTPHTAIATSEIFSHAQGYGNLVDFPARWFGAAFEYAYQRGLQGFLVSSAWEHPLHDGMLYMLSRLAWKPDANVDDITREYASAVFGVRAGPEMAEILLMGSESVRHGLYLMPLSLTGWNPIPLTRGDKFVRAGNPLWDKGRGHEDFLRDFYLMCKPYYEDVYERVGLAPQITARMLDRFRAVESSIVPSPARDAMGPILEHGHALMKVARDYTRTFLSYFAYRDVPNGKRRARLAADIAALETSAAAYRARHREYDLIGIDQTLELARRMAADRESAERILREAPTPDQLARKFADGRAESRRLLAAHPHAEKIVAWQGVIDGSAVLRVRDRQVAIENLAYNPVTHEKADFARAVPREAGARYALREVQVRGIAYLMEEPSASNNFTASIYLEDPAPGCGVFVLELYRLRF